MIQSKKEKTMTENQDFVTLPSGGKAKRCKAKNNRGERCGLPARIGFEVCGKHGAGFATREAKNQSRPAGRPIVHGAYSTKTQQRLETRAQEILQDKQKLESGNEALASLQALNAFLLENADTAQNLMVSLEGQLERLKAIEPKEIDKDYLEQFNAIVRDAPQLIRDSLGYFNAVSVNALRVTTALKLRAETSVKLANAKQIDMLLHWVSVVRACILDANLEDSQRQFIDSEMRRRLFGELGGQLPVPRHED
jgi:hypothetical protein